MGTMAALATIRLSCSFWELYMPGSSATTSTNPPLTPVYAAVYSGSAATFIPTCFMTHIERTPAMDAPMATSVATFSLGAHSA